MIVNSGGSDRVGGSGPKRTTGAAQPDAPGRANGRARSRPPVQTDRVQISQAARDLLGAAGMEADEAGALDPARLREILDRMADGTYSGFQVRTELLLNLATELGLDGF